MTLAERCARLYGPRPVQIFDPDFDSAAARERRAIVRQATGKADSLLQIQAIFHCAFIFGLLITPLPIAVGAYLLLQLTELHALIVYRAVYRAAQDPRASLVHFKRPIRQLSYSLAIAGGICLFLVYVVAPESWSLGVLAGCGVAAAYFIPFAKQNGAILYTTLGILHASIQRMLAMVRFFMPRTKGNGWRLQKFHDLLHLAEDTKRFGPAPNYDAGPHESGLRTWAKLPALTSQKIGGAEPWQGPSGKWNTEWQRHPP